MYLIVSSSEHCDCCRAVIRHCAALSQPQIFGGNLADACYVAAMEVLIDLIIIEMTIALKDMSLPSIYLYLFAHIMDVMITA